MGVPTKHSPNVYTFSLAWIVLTTIFILFRHRADTIFSRLIANLNIVIVLNEVPHHRDKQIFFKDKKSHYELWQQNVGNQDIIKQSIQSEVN